MKRFNRSTLLAAMAACGILSTMLVYAEDPPADVVRAATGRSSTEKPAAEKADSKTAEPEAVAPPLLLDTGDESESRLNRAAVRYGNLARRWPTASKEWKERARETLRRIDELLADPGIQDQLATSKASSGSEKTDAVTPIPTDVTESKPQQLPPGVTEDSAPTIVPVSDEQPAEERSDAGEARKPIEQPAKASLDADRAKKAPCHDTALARRCEELANELQRMAATLRKTVGLKK